MPRGKYERKKNKVVKPTKIVMTELAFKEALNEARRDGEQAGLIKQRWRENNKDVVEAWNMATPFDGAKSAISTDSNPKTLTGQQKVPILSVIPPASIIAQGTAMRYGAYLAPRVDGKRGYGPYNWRDQPIEAHIYIDAAMRHLLQWFDGEEHEIIRNDEGHHIDTVSHLAFALATIGILLDAQANDTLIDDRPKVRKMAASMMLNQHKIKESLK